MRKRYFIQFRLFPILFLLFLTLPYLNKYLPIIEKKKSTENRALAEEPKFDIELLDPFPEQYEEFYNDHFSLRNNYNRFYNYSRFVYFGINPNPKKVILGKDNWMFFNTEMLPSKKERNLFTNEELHRIAEELEARENYLRQKNCAFYVGVIPAKPSIYFEKLDKPHYAKKYDSLPTIGEQFCTYMDSSTDLKVLNFRPELLKYKEHYNIYHKYDHHCNYLGGFFMAKQMLEYIQKDYPDLKMSLALDDFDIEYKVVVGGNLSKLLGVNDYVSENRPYLSLKDTNIYLIDGELKNYPYPEGFKYTDNYEIRKSTKDSTLLNCMVIRDSFGQYYQDFLSLGFNNTLYIWDKWEYQLNKEIFEIEKPDVLIILILESQLSKFENSSCK